MGKQGVLAGVLRFLRTVVLIDLGIFAAVGVICWIGGWRTAYHYSYGLILAGVGAMALGAYSVVGSLHTSRSFDYQYASSAGLDSVRKGASQEWKDAGARYAFLGLMCAVGCVPIAVGILVQIALN